MQRSLNSTIVRPTLLLSCLVRPLFEFPSSCLFLIMKYIEFLFQYGSFSSLFFLSFTPSCSHTRTDAACTTLRISVIFPTGIYFKIYSLLQSPFLLQLDQHFLGFVPPSFLYFQVSLSASAIVFGFCRPTQFHPMDLLAWLLLIPPHPLVYCLR